jgi:hypothetical protein
MSTAGSGGQNRLPDPHPAEGSAITVPGVIPAISRVNPATVATQPVAQESPDTSAIQMPNPASDSQQLEEARHRKIPFGCLVGIQPGDDHQATGVSMTSLVPASYR